MIVALLGVPSPLTYTAINVLRAVVQVIKGDHNVLVVNSMADLKANWPDAESRGAGMVLGADLAEPDLIEFLIKSKIPLFVCIEPIAEIVYYMMRARRADFLSSLRIATRALSGMEAIAVSPPPIAVRVSPSPLPVRRIINDLLRYLQNDVTPEAVAQVLSFLDYGGFENEPFHKFLSDKRGLHFPPETVSDAVGPSSLDAMSEVARGYDPVYSGQPVSEMLWPAPCFLRTDTLDESFDGHLNLEGRARYLTSGPYFHLPAGRWEAEIGIDVAESWSENRVGFDVFSGAVLAARTATLPVEGAFACDLTFTIVDCVNPVEIRMYLLSGAIEGRVRLRGVRLKRVASPFGQA